MIGRGVSKLDTPKKIQQSLEIWKESYNGQTILWRISSEYIKRFYKRRRTAFQVQYDAKVDEIAKTFDAAKLVREETRRLGQKFLLYATFLDHGAPTTDLFSGTTPFPWQDQETLEHPEYQERDLRGNFHYGVLDLAEPKARQFMVKRLVDFVNEYNADGLYLCSRTHSVPALHADQFGFGPKVVAEYKKRYGIDITNDSRFDWKNEKFAPHSPEVEKWRHLRGEYLLEFLRELKTELRNKLLYVALPGGDYLSAPYGNMYIDNQNIIRHRLVDGLVMGVISGRWLYPKDKTPHKDRGYLLSYDDKFNIPSRKNIIEKYAHLCAQNKVKLFYRYGYRRNMLEQGLSGVMIDAPNVRSSLLFESSPLFTSKSLSIDGWFYLMQSPTYSPSAPRLLSKYYHEKEIDRGWELLIDSKTGILSFRTYLQLPDGSCRSYTLKANQKIPQKKWIHIAAVFDRSKHENRIYLNGKLAGTLSIPPNSSLYDNNGIDVILGGYARSTQEAQMKVDELRISNLPQTFIEAPQTPYTGREIGTLALFHFDSPEKKADVLPSGLKLHFIGTPSIVPGHFDGCMNIQE